MVQLLWSVAACSFEILLFSVCKCASRSGFSQGVFMLLESAKPTILTDMAQVGFEHNGVEHDVGADGSVSTRKLWPTSLAKQMCPVGRACKCSVDNSPISASRLRESITTESSPRHNLRNITPDSDVLQNKAGHLLHVDSCLLKFCRPTCRSKSNHAYVPHRHRSSRASLLSCQHLESLRRRHGAEDLLCSKLCLSSCHV